MNSAAPLATPIQVRRTRGQSGWVNALRLAPLLPATLILLLFMGTAIGWSMYSSLTNAALSGPNAANPSFIGIGNYTRLLSDPNFPKSVWLTVVFVLASGAIGQNALGIALALLMEKANLILRRITSTLVVAAWVIPDVVACYVAYAYFAKDGTLNVMLGWLGAPPNDWLYNTPMLAVILANIWRGTAFSMMMYQAALMNVPSEITESAKVDGAGGLKRLFYITLPLINRTVATNLMLTTLQTISVFTLIYVMTKGGPGTNSSTLPVLAYQEAFQSSQVGYGTAIATVLLLIGAFFSVLYIKVLKPEVH